MEEAKYGIQFEEDARLTGESKRTEYIAYHTRWLQLVLFSLVSIANALMWITFAPIAPAVESYYGVSAFGVNALSLIFMVMYIPLVFPAGWVLDNIPRHLKYPIPFGGLRDGLLVGAIGTALGTCVRGMGGSYAFCFIGQFIGAVVQPFILNAPPMLSANWFPKDQRTLATTICSVANPVGVALGFVMPPLLVIDGNLEILLFVQAIICVLVAVIAVLFIREKPPTPPSESAGLESRDESIISTIKDLGRNVNFWILFIAFGFGLGAFNTLATLIDQLVAPYGYNETQSGVMGAMVVISGLVGAGVAGAVVDKFKCYKLVLLVCFASAAISVAMFVLVIQTEIFWLLIIASILLGGTMMPILPVSLELAVEIAYPIREATPTGLLMCQGQIVGIALIVLMSLLIGQGYIHGAIWLVFLCVTVSFLLLLFFTGKPKRDLVNTEAI